MAKEEQLRASIRLRIDKGMVTLHAENTPALACELVDLSEGGCRAQVPLPNLDEISSEHWTRVLGLGRSLKIEITCPPHLAHFPALVEVRNVAPTHDGGMEVGLRFEKLPDDQKRNLNKAILSFATDKVRTAFGPHMQGQTAQYLVGGRTNLLRKTFDEGHSEKAPPGRSGTRLITVPKPPPSASSASLTITPPKISPAASGGVSAVPVGSSASRQAVPVPPASAGSGAAYAAVPPPDAGAPAHAPEREAPPPAPPAAGSGQYRVQDRFRGKRIGEVLVQMGKLNDEQVNEAAARAKAGAERLGRYLLREGMVSPASLCRALALQSGLPMTDLSSVEMPEHLTQLFAHSTMLRHEFVPFDESMQMLCVACANPLPESVALDLERQVGKRIEFFLAQEDLVLQCIDRLMPKEKRVERKHMRYHAELPVVFQFCNRLGRPAEDGVHRGATIDLSEGGFLVQGEGSRLGQPENLMRRGLCLRLTLTLQTIEATGLCSMRFIKPVESRVRPEWEWQYGLQILEMTAEERRKLKEICIQVGLQIAKGG